MSTVCAIIPTFNRSHFLQECLHSILNQSRRVDDIIVVNDGSTDDTEMVLRNLAAPCRVIHQANSGKAAALNAALRICDADFVWICDDDDVADARGAETLADALDANPSADFVYGRFLIFHETPQGRVFYPPVHWARAEEPSLLINVLEESFTFQFAQMARRSAFRRVGDFREDLLRSQDYEMFIRLARFCTPLFVPSNIFYQRNHEGQRGARSDNFPVEQRREKWLKYDQMIFRELRTSLDLDEVVPTFALGFSESTRRRMSLLQRSCIFAQRALWKFALDDLQEACCLGREETPLADEVHLASVVIRNPLSWGILTKTESEIARLKACASSGRYGRIIAVALLRPLVWQAQEARRSGKFRICIRNLRLIISILGLRGAAARLLDSALR